MKNLYDHIVSRPHDLPNCSAVIHPTALIYGKTSSFYKWCMIGKVYWPFDEWNINWWRISACIFVSLLACSQSSNINAFRFLMAGGSGWNDIICVVQPVGQVRYLTPRNNPEGYNFESTFRKIIFIFFFPLLQYSAGINSSVLIFLTAFFFN